LGSGEAGSLVDNTLSKTLIFGNSGSGKSTLAQRLSAEAGQAHLDLDTLAWQAVSPPERHPLEKSEREITAFIETHEHWVIEGCYADLISLALPFTQELIFLDLSVDDCVLHAQGRPWEPHKYASKAAQDANLEMLINWIREYPIRTDTCSRGAHLAVYESFSGKKTRITQSADLH